MENIKFCPECLKEDEKSCVFIGITTRTAMAPPNPYYDEEGVFRIPKNPNTTTINYSCSRGHTWSEKF